MQIIINLSNRHLHLCQSDIEKLFGKNYELTEHRQVMQSDYFEAKETLELLGNNEETLTMHIVAPPREESQCEILTSDLYKLNFKDIPVKKSGDLNGTPEFTLRGPKGDVKIEKGLIIAQRHIHMDTKTAQENNLKNGQTVSIKTGISGKEMTLHSITLRIKDEYVPECHLDFDEGNAAGIKQGTKGEIII